MTNQVVLIADNFRAGKITVREAWQKLQDAGIPIAVVNEWLLTTMRVRA